MGHRGRLASGTRSCKLQRCQGVAGPPDGIGHRGQRYGACSEVGRARSQVMFSNKLAFTLVAAACITAAGGGGFLALRQNATSPAPAAIASSADSASLVSAERPVQETEAIVPPELPAVAKPTVKPATPRPPPSVRSGPRSLIRRPAPSRRLLPNAAGRATPLPRRRPPQFPRPSPRHRSRRARSKRSSDLARSRPRFPRRHRRARSSTTSSSSRRIPSSGCRARRPSRAIARGSRTAWKRASPAT